MCPEGISDTMVRLMQSKDVGGAYALCNENTNSFTNVLSAALLKVNFDRDRANKESMDQAAGEELDYEETAQMQWVNYLNVFATIAPMIGLFGTVLGMMQSFGDLSAGGEDDNDGDGSSNLEEFNADTDPLDAGDFLRILTVEQSANGVAITWPANPGRSYSVYRNDDLTQGNWILIQEGRTVDVAGELTVTDASIDNPRTRFYQVRSQSPPLPE